MIQTIAESLHISYIEAYWAGTSFVLASAVCQPLFPACAAALGRRATSIVALIVFVVGTVLCSVSHGPATFLAGRTMQGIGAGGMLALTYVAMVDLFEIRKRGSAMAIVGIAWLLGTAIGPIIGGAVCAHATWRW